MAAEGMYWDGLRRMDLETLQQAAIMFPLDREIRSGPAYWVTMRHGPRHILREALRHDPNNAELWLYLSRFAAQDGDMVEAELARRNLERLPPLVDVRGGNLD
jgi:hypothetical protein